MHSYEVAEQGLLKPVLENPKSQVLIPKCPGLQPESQICKSPHRTKPPSLHHCLTRSKFSCPPVSQVTVQNLLLLKNACAQKGEKFCGCYLPWQSHGMHETQVAPLHRMEMSHSKVPLSFVEPTVPKTTLTPTSSLVQKYIHILQTPHIM